MAEVIDIRPTLDSAGDHGKCLFCEVLAGLSKPHGQKTLPQMLLYDERGLRLFEDIITKAPEYYVFSAEDEIFNTYSEEIVRAMGFDSDHGNLEGNAGKVVLELGAGSLRKTKHVLRALAHHVPRPCAYVPITYYALDLQERQLHYALEQIVLSDVGPEIEGRIGIRGLLGTYVDGIRWFISEGGLRNQITVREGSGFATRVVEGVKQGAFPASTSTSTPALISTDERQTDTAISSMPGDAQPPLHILFIGASLCNFSRGEDAAFLKSLPLRPHSGDTLLLSLDHHKDDATKIELAYNDRQGYSRRFASNGLRAAGKAVGHNTLFEEGKWEYCNKYDVEARRHDALFRSVCDQRLLIPQNQQYIAIRAGEMVRVGFSNKYTEEDTTILFRDANLKPINRWMDSCSQCSVWLLERI